MAISQEEAEMLQKVESSDFYAAFMALVLYRYETRDKAWLRSEKAEGITQIVNESFADLESDT